MVEASLSTSDLSAVLALTVGVTSELFNYFLSSVNRSSWYPWPTLARSEPTRTGSAGGQLRALNRLRAEALATLPLASMPVR